MSIYREIISAGKALPRGERAGSSLTLAPFSPASANSFPLHRTGVDASGVQCGGKRSAYRRRNARADNLDRSWRPLAQADRGCRFSFGSRLWTVLETT